MNRKIITLLLGGMLTFHATAFEFASQGTAKAVIILPRQPEEEEKIAAETLRSTLQQITGAAFKIRQEGNAIDGNRIFVGRTSALPAGFSEKLLLGQTLPFGDVNNDAFLIVERGKDLFLAGHHAKATRYAVHALLEHIGCRWYFACKAGTVFPKNSSLSINIGQSFRRPAFYLRYFYSWNARSQEVIRNDIEWGVANRLTGDYSGAQGHNYKNIWPRKSYPELFPAIPGGKITTQVCLLHPKTWEIGAQWADVRIRKNPDSMFVTFMPNDGYGYCECPACRAAGNIADRHIRFANEIGRRFFPAHPEKRIMIAAYAAGASCLPTGKIDGYEEQRERVTVNIYEFFTKVPLMDLVQAWSRATHSIVVTRNWYDFSLNFGASCRPWWKDLQQDFRELLNAKVKALRIQNKADWAMSGLSRYLAARQMWDPGFSSEAMILDFAEKMFPSAPNEAYNLADLYRNYGSTVSFESFMARGFHLLRRMQAKVKTPEEQFRCDFYAAYFCYNALVDELGDALQKKKPEDVIRRYRRFIAFLKGMEHLQSLETHQRIAVHTKTIARYGKLSMREARKLVAAIPLENLNHAVLLQMTEKAAEKYKEPELSTEFLPFSE